ncbi:MAG TPA: hypothetical protein VFU07_06835 [Candidatus Lumbricidophila sp.]|nr:hypothetical protein [Candidatus Lumbricidophila sp.]
MLDQGFTVKVNPDTSFEATTPKGQEEPFALAMYTCEAKYPRPFILSHPDDETSGRTLYAYYRDILIGCLTKLGQTPAPLPSEQVFLQNLNTAERYDPYASLLGNGGMDFQEWNEATTNCPQRPASLGG